MIKTFRGMLADGGQDHIRLQTIKGKVGYRIVKFQVLTGGPSVTSTVKALVSIWKTQQTTLSVTANFTDSDLLAAASYGEHRDKDIIIVFDNEVFNQDIYLTSKCDSSPNTDPMNYYLELEVIPLDDAGAEYTTLKDLRTS
jgi:hypothetical protein